MEIREAYILAGGKGERLRPLTLEKPKPLLPIKGKPILEWNIEGLKRFGVEKIVIGAGYMWEKIEEYFGNGEKFGVKIRYAIEDQPLGTGGAVRHAAEHLGKRFFMINGDNMADFDYGKMMKIHKKKKAGATIMLHEVDDVTSFGAARLEDDKITEFIEKPEKGKEPSRFINAGAYIIEKKHLQLMPCTYCLIEKEMFPKLAKKKKLYACIHHGQWFPTDTISRYSLAEEKWKGQQK